MERTHPKGKTDDLHLYCWGNRDDSYLVCQSVPLYSVNTAPSFKCKFHVLLPFWILSVNLYSLSWVKAMTSICNSPLQWSTGKKVKYQFWNNTGVSVVLYWGIIGMFTRIPTLEKWYIYQCWHVTIVSQHWEIIILIGISLEVLFCFTNLGIFAQFPHLGKCSFSLENCWNIYFVLPTLVYCNDLPILGSVVIHWKTIGIFILFHRRWYIVTISQYWEMLLFIGKLLE